MSDGLFFSHPLVRISSMEENEETKKTQEKAKRELPFDIGALCYSLFLFAAAL